MRLPSLAHTGLLAGTSIWLVTTSALAADIAATSKIDAVTVYRAGAEVSRRVEQDIAAGSHTLIIKDLPAEALAGSVRVEGQADDALLIGSVDTRRVSLLSTDDEAATEKRKELEEDLEQLTDALDQLRAEIETKEAQKTFISNLTALPRQAPAPPANSARPSQDWPAILELIGTSMAAVQSDILKTQIAKRQLGRRIEDVKKQLSKIAPKKDQRTEVRVSLEAGTDLKANLIVRYQIRSASWRPHYDARLTTGAAGEQKNLTLTRRAAIRQRTGEAWNNVALRLSTSRPSGKSSAPELLPLTVDFKKPPRPVVGQLSARKGGGSRYRNNVPQAESRGAAQQSDAVVAAAPRKVRERNSQLERTAFQASFAVPGRVTIANTGEAKRVKLEDQKISPDLNVRAVPRRDTSAYLYAKLTMPRSAPYLAGPVSLFRDGSFVGTGRLPNLAPAAEHELGFGADPSVTVKYHILAEKRGESGIISSSSTDQRNFRIDVTNSHEQPIDVIIIDQMPVSLNEDITVELTGPTSPTKKNYGDKRGLLAWSFKLKPADNRSIRFGYTIAWPADKEVGFATRR